MRLDKFLVEMGIGSRSQVKQYVKKGTVTVNGAPVKSSDVKIDENNDTIKYNGRILNYSRYRYFLLNKPAGCVSATKDKRASDRYRSAKRRKYKRPVTRGTAGYRHRRTSTSDK